VELEILDKESEWKYSLYVTVAFSQDFVTILILLLWSFPKLVVGSTLYYSTGNHTHKKTWWMMETIWKKKLLHLHWDGVPLPQVLLFLPPDFTYLDVLINQSTTVSTEHHGWVVNTPISYSGGLRFKFQPQDWLSWLMYFVVFLRPSRQINVCACVHVCVTVASKIYYLQLFFLIPWHLQTHQVISLLFLLQLYLVLHFHNKCVTTHTV
jgi:hypothetical protein